MTHHAQDREVLDTIALGLAALNGMRCPCPAGEPVFIRVDDPDTGNSTHFDDPHILLIAMNKGLVPETVRMEGVVMVGDYEIERARAVAWRYMVQGKEVPQSVVDTIRKAHH